MKKLGIHAAVQYFPPDGAVSLYRGAIWNPPGRKLTASRSTSKGNLVSQAMSRRRTWPGGLQV